MSDNVSKRMDAWIWTVISAMGTIILAGSTTFMTVVYSQVQSLEASVARQGAHLAGLEVQNNITDKRLERIEIKIDKLLEVGVKKSGGQ